MLCVKQRQSAEVKKKVVATRMVERLVNRAVDPEPMRQ
jgi:hypothetical protein